MLYEILEKGITSRHTISRIISIYKIFQLYLQPHSGENDSKTLQ